MNELRQVKQQLKEAEDFIKELSENSNLRNCDISAGNHRETLFHQSWYKTLPVVTVNLDGFTIKAKSMISEAVKSVNKDLKRLNIEYKR